MLVDGYCDEGIAVFIITNTGDPGSGDMESEGLYRIYRNYIFETSGTFQLDGGESIFVNVTADYDAIRIVVYQNPGHPGTGYTRFTIEDCGCDDCDDDDDDNDDNSTEEPDDNTTNPPDDNTTEEPDDNSTEEPDDNSTETPDDNSTENPGDDNTTSPPDDNSSTDPNDDNSTTQPDDNSTEEPNDNSTQPPDHNSTENPGDDNTTSPPDGNSTDDPSDEDTGSTGSSSSGSSSSSTTKTYSSSKTVTPPNIPPIAQINLENNVVVFTEENIIFDGSESTDEDGTINEWTWAIEPEIILNGEKISHIFEKTGTFTVSLTVVDDDGDENSTSINVIVEKANSKPTKPSIIGPKTLTVNTDYSYIFESIDAEDDVLQYHINWGDGTSIVTDMDPSKTSVSLIHSWEESGNFTIQVQTFDGELYSEENSIQIQVNDIIKANLGYIILLIFAISEFIVLTIKTAINDRKKLLLH